MVVKEVLASEQAVVEEVFPNEDVSESCQEVLCDDASRNRVQLQRPKKVKKDLILECLVCHAVFKRKDKHLNTLTFWKSQEITFINDFYRTKNVQKNYKIYDCTACYRQFLSLVTHKNTNKCDCSSITRVQSPESRA